MASGYRVAAHITVRIYWCPDLVFDSGPTQSIITRSNGSPSTGIGTGCKGAGGTVWLGFLTITTPYYIDFFGWWWYNLPTSQYDLIQFNWIQELQSEAISNSHPSQSYTFIWTHKNNVNLKYYIFQAYFWQEELKQGHYLNYGLKFSIQFALHLCIYIFRWVCRYTYYWWDCLIWPNMPFNILLRIIDWTSTLVKIWLWLPGSP